MAGTHLLLAPGLGVTGPLSTLLARLARRHAVHAHDPGLGPAAAVLTRPRSTWPLPRGDSPVAWWIEHPSEIPERVPERVRLLLTWPPAADAVALLAGDDVPVEVVPAPGIDGSAWRPVVPFVRARWRRRFDLPERLVVTVGTPTSPPLDDATASDALFLCSAAVVGPGHVLRSLALAAPTVCDASTAALVGAVDGRDVVVADGGAATAAAEALAGDLQRATTLARAGRRLVEARHDVAESARRVAAHLGLPPLGDPPVARLAGALDELGTPTDAGVVARVAGAVGTLGPSGVDVAVRSLRW